MKEGRKENLNIYKSITMTGNNEWSISKIHILQR